MGLQQAWSGGLTKGGSVVSDRIRQRQELGLIWSCPKDKEGSQRGAASILYATFIFSVTKKALLIEGSNKTLL